MNRRRLILSAAGAGLVVGGLAVPAGVAAAAATDDELAFANFGLGAEFLHKDFFAKAAEAKLFENGAAREIVRGGFCSAEHAAALTKLLVDAGQTAAVEEDFELVWPDGTFAAQKPAASAGLAVTQPLLGAYLNAAATISIPSYRTLFASMAANLAQRAAFLSQQAGGRIVGISFPAAVDLETASAALEPYLG